MTFAARHKSFGVETDKAKARAFEAVIYEQSGLHHVVLLPIELPSLLFLLPPPLGGDGRILGCGSQEVKKDEAAPTAEAAPAAETVATRTVAAVAPVFIDYAREIRISGATEADKQAVLAARASGIVHKLGVAKGGAIAADALVVELEGSEVIAGVDTAQAALEQATETLRVGQALYDKGSLPELELITRKAAKAAAEAGLSQAKAAQDRLALKAPFAGTVDTVDVELGEWVQTGASIATILALDPIVVKAEVSERDVAFVTVGSKAKVRLVDGVEMEGVVRHVSAQASENTDLGEWLCRTLIIPSGGDDGRGAAVHGGGACGGGAALDHHHQRGWRDRSASGGAGQQGHLRAGDGD